MTDREQEEMVRELDDDSMIEPENYELFDEFDISLQEIAEGLGKRKDQITLRDIISFGMEG